MVLNKFDTNHYHESYVPDKGRLLQSLALCQICGYLRSHRFLVCNFNNLINTMQFACAKV